MPHSSILTMSRMMKGCRMGGAMMKTSRCWMMCGNMRCIVERSRNIGDQRHGQVSSMWMIGSVMRCQAIQMMMMTMMVSRMMLM